ncbi:MAG: hypothetical protein ACI84R_001225 [Candidatus Azotimanducaceae bacterium]|jgi:hypothetical protein
MSDHNFESTSDLNNIIKAIGPEAVAKLIETAAEVSVLASQSLGVKLTTSEITQVDSVKFAVIGDVPLNMNDALDQLRAVPSVATKIAAKKSVDEVAQGHTNSLDGLTRTQRMNYAREHGLAGSASTEDGTSQIDHTRVLASLAPRNRLDYARRHGLA